MGYGTYRQGKPKPYNTDYLAMHSQLLRPVVLKRDILSAQEMTADANKRPRNVPGPWQCIAAWWKRLSPGKIEKWA